MQFLVILDFTQGSHDFISQLERGLQKLPNNDVQIMRINHFNGINELALIMETKQASSLLIVYQGLERVIYESLTASNFIDSEKITNYKAIISKILALHKANRKNVGLVELEGLFYQKYHFLSSPFYRLVIFSQETLRESQIPDNFNEQWLVKQYINVDVEFSDIYTELQAASILLCPNCTNEINLEPLLISYFQSKHDSNSLQKVNQQNHVLLSEIDSLKQQYAQAIDKNDIMIRQLELVKTKQETNNSDRIKLLTEENTLLLNELFKLQESYFVDIEKSTNKINSNAKMFTISLAQDIKNRYFDLNNIQGCLELCIYSHRINVRRSIKDVFSSESILDKIQLTDNKFNKIAGLYDLQIDYAQYQKFYDCLVYKGIQSLHEALNNFTGDSVKKAKIYLTFALYFKNVDFSVAYHLAYLGFVGYINSLLQKQGINGVCNKIKNLPIENKFKGIYLIQISRAFHDNNEDTTALESILIKEAINLDKSADTLVGAYWASKKMAQRGLVEQILKLLLDLNDQASNVEMAIASANKYLKLKK